MNAQALRIAGFSGILAIAALRAMVTIQAQVWFDVDPAVDPMPLLSLACAWSHGLDALLLIASGVALIGEQKSGRGLHHTLIALAFLPLPIVAWHGWTNAVDAFRLDTWLAAAVAFAALAHLVRERRLRVVALSIFAGLAIALAVRGAVQVTVEHDATVALYEETREAFLVQRGWAPDSSAARTYERRLMQAEATGWFGFSNPFSTMMGVGALLLAVTAFTARSRIASGNVLLLVLASIGCVALLAINGGKGAICATAIGVALCVWSLRSRTPLRGGIAFVLALGVLIAVVARGIVGMQLGELSLFFRALYLEAAVNMISSLPREAITLGFGPSGVQELFNSAKPAICPEDVSSVHSVFVDWLLALGVLGGAWAAMIACAFRERVCVRDDETQQDNSTTHLALCIALAISIVSLLVQALVETPALGAAELMLRVIGFAVFVLVTTVFAAAATMLPARVIASIAFASAVIVLVHAQIEMTMWLPSSCVLALALCATGSWVPSVVPVQRVSIASRSIITLACVLSIALCMHDAFDAWRRDRQLFAATQLLTPIASARASGDGMSRDTEISHRLEAVELLAGADTSRSPVPIEAQVRQLTAIALLQSTTTLNAVDTIAFERAMSIATTARVKHPARVSAILGELAFEKLRRSATLDNHARSELIEAIERAVVAQPHNLRILTELAEAYALVGRVDDAKRTAQRSLELNSALGLDPLAQLVPREFTRLDALANPQ